MSDVEDAATYLRSKALDVYRAAGSEVTLHCLWCSDGDFKGKGKLYVNTESWFFDCKRCGTKGGKKMLLDHFGDDYDDSRYEPGKDPARRRRVLEEYVELTEDMILKNEPRLMYLLRRGLSGETISENRLGYAPRGMNICDSLPSSYKPGGFTRADLESSGMLSATSGKDFHQGKITIPYLTSGSPIQVRGKDPDGKYFTPSGDVVRLYNSDALRGVEIAFLCEGEFDCLMVQQVLRAQGRTDVAVVGIPGAGALPGGSEGFADYFEQAKRVYIGLDADEVGRREAVKIKALLGSKARLVELPETGLLDSRGEEVKLDWTEYLRSHSADHPYGGHSGTDVLALMSEAEMLGKRLFTMGDAGHQWAKEDMRGGIKLGFPMLDAIIKPGLKPGNLVIPLAKTGCIQGDAKIAVNRGGKGFTIRLCDLLDRWEGRKYAWRRDIPTYIQREVDGEVRLGLLQNAWRSGIKVTYTVTTETGRTLRATDEHPFLTERGWLRLDDLVAGDLVHVRGQQSTNGCERVVSVERYDEEETFDLEVADDPHNFLANGFVVHNTGKTVFLSNIAHNLRFEPVLFISLEQLAGEVYDIFRRVARFWNPRFDDAQIQNEYPLMRIVDENRLRREDFAVLVQEFTDEVGMPPRVVIVDYLGYYAKGMSGGSPYEKVSNAALQLKEEGKAHKLSIIAPHQVSRGAKDGKPFDADDARDSGVVEETGDFVLGLFRPSEAVDDARAKGIVTDALGCSILKSRKGGKGRIVNMSMSQASLVIVDASDRKTVNRIQIENAHYNKGEHYDEIYRRQRTEADRTWFDSHQLDLQIGRA